MIRDAYLVARGPTDASNNTKTHGSEARARVGLYGGFDSFLTSRLFFLRHTESVGGCVMRHRLSMSAERALDMARGNKIITFFQPIEAGLWDEAGEMGHQSKEEDEERGSYISKIKEEEEKHLSLACGDHLPYMWGGGEGRLDVV
jgi:hypothetical protein